jgi:hypothetical protein
MSWFDIFSNRLLAPYPAMSEETSKGMPAWQLPRPMPSLLTFYQQFYPLRVFNSMTRTAVPFIPMNGRQVVGARVGFSARLRVFRSP